MLLEECTAPSLLQNKKIPFTNDYIQLRSVLKLMPLLTTLMLRIGCCVFKRPGDVVLRDVV